MPNVAKTPQSLPVADYAGMLRDIRRLIYLYLFLLMIEGALRKWIVPQFSNPLLLVRDPVVLAIYFLAWRAHIFPRNGFILWLAIIGVLSWIVFIHFRADLLCHRCGCLRALRRSSPVDLSQLVAFRSRLQRSSGNCCFGESFAGDVSSARHAFACDRAADSP